MVLVVQWSWRVMCARMCNWVRVCVCVCEHPGGLEGVSCYLFCPWQWWSLWAEGCLQPPQWRKATWEGHRDTKAWAEQISRVCKIQTSGPQSAVLRPLQVPTGSNGASGAIFNISVCLAETTHLPKIRLHRLLTETSFLCFWLESYQLGVITLLISRWSEPLIGSHTWLWLIKNGKTNYYLINAVCLVDKNL